MNELTTIIAVATLIVSIPALAESTNIAAIVPTTNTGQFSWSAAGRGFVVGDIGEGVSKYLGGKGW